MAEKKSSYTDLAQNIDRLASSLASLGDSASAISNLSSGISDIVGLGSEVTGLLDMIKNGFSGSGGVTALVGFGISTLINFATDLSKKVQEVYEANVEDFNTGANSLSREGRGYSFSTDTQDVMEMVAEAKEGHAPMDESSMEDGAFFSSMMKKGNYKNENVDEFMENAGLAYEYQYQLYLEELEGVLQASMEREEAAKDAFNEATANGMSDEEATEIYNEAMRQSSEQLAQEVNNAQKAYNTEMMTLTQGVLKSVGFEMTEEMQKYMDIIQQGYGEGNISVEDALWRLLNSLSGTDADRILQGVNDAGYFETMGLTEENRVLRSWLFGPEERSYDELYSIFMSFFGGVDPNASQYGDVEGTYRYNSAAETVETPQVEETTQTGAINYQEITSAEDFANLYGGISEDSETYAGLSSSVAAILPQVFSSEEFGASLTTALTTAFASEDLWATLGETINGGFTMMVEGQLETFTEYGTSLGSAMTAGLAQGIDSGTARVCSSIRSMASRAVIEARKRLDINSPSRVFREIGLSTGEGFALGIDESLLMAENAATRMAEGVARAGAGTNSAAGRGAVVNLNVNQPSIRSDDDVRRLSEEFARYTAAMTYGL